LPRTQEQIDDRKTQLTLSALQHIRIGKTAKLIEIHVSSLINTSRSLDTSMYLWARGCTIPICVCAWGIFQDFTVFSMDNPHLAPDKSASKDFMEPATRIMSMGNISIKPSK
jgi:hypothetical protein